MRNAESAQHGNLGCLAVGGITRRNCDRGHCDHQGQDDRERKKLAGALQRPAHFGAGVFEILNFLAGLQVSREPDLEVCDSARLSGKHQAVAHPAAGNHEPGSSEIFEIHQYPRRKIENSAAAIRLEGQQPTAIKIRSAEIQPRGHQLRELGIDPNLPLGGYFRGSRAFAGHLARPLQPPA